MELLQGALLQGGKYKIEKVLGQGGFGITYLAEQTNLGRKVCIKEFFMKEYGERTAAPEEDTQETVLTDGGHPSGQMPNDKDATVLTGVSAVTSAAAAIMGRYREKFVKEAKTIAKLDHPGIVRIHDVFEENGTAYYVMDFIEGENLNDLVKREGALSEERALGYIRQVADALSYVHGHNIMHLDVKPANIIIRKADDKAILIDFGAAKQYDSEGTQTSTTPIGLSAGYAPIEMMKVGGVKTFSPETDVYSLGATLYYLVTGQNPPDASERMEMVMEGETMQHPNSVSSSVMKAIEAAMQSKKQRPKTVRAFMDLLVSCRSEAEDNARMEEKRKEALRQEHERAEAERQAKREAETKEREKEEAEKKRIADEKAREEAEAKRQEASRREQEKAEVEKKRIAEKEAQNKKTMMWALIALVAVVCVMILIRSINDSSHSTSDYPDEFSAAELLGYTGSKNGYQWVDLGLSVKWATCNVGAMSPEDYGDYFAWGETATKNEYTWANYRFRASGDSNNNVTYSKYNSTSERGSVDNKIRLELSDDSACANWGGDWRMPTFEEWSELQTKCKWTWERQDGKNGYRVTGSNGYSIFLPAAGERYGSYLYKEGSIGSYWSSSLSTDYLGTVWDVVFDSGGVKLYDWNDRCDGRSVRPVR